MAKVLLRKHLQSQSHNYLSLVYLKTKIPLPLIIYINLVHFFLFYASNPQFMEIMIDMVFYNKNITASHQFTFDQASKCSTQIPSVSLININITAEHIKVRHEHYVVP